MARFRAVFTGFSLLLLVFGSLLSVPSVFAQEGQGIGDAAKSCGQRTAYVPDLSTGSVLAFESTRECVATALDGGDVFTAYLRLVKSGDFQASISSLGLLPNSSAEVTWVYEDGSIPVSESGWFVSAYGSLNGTFSPSCDDNLASVTVSATTVGGATLSATIEFPPC